MSEASHVVNRNDEPDEIVACADNMLCQYLKTIMFPRRGYV